MEHEVAGKIRLELHQKVMAAKVCKSCGFASNPWDGLICMECEAPLPEETTVKEDRGLVASSEEEVI